MWEWKFHLYGRKIEKYLHKIIFDKNYFYMLPKLSIFWSCLYGSKLTLYVGSAVSKLQETLNCQYIKKKKKKEFVDRWCAWQLWLNGLNGHHGLAEISKEYPCHLLEGEKSNKKWKERRQGEELCRSTERGIQAPKPVAVIHR